MGFRKHLKNLSVLFSFLLLFLTGGCDEFGPLDGVFPDPSMRLVQEDTLLKSGTTLDVEINFSENIPDLITGRLQGSGGYDESLTVEPPPEGWGNSSGLPGRMTVPSGLPEGYFVLTLAAWRGEKLLAEMNRRYFITGEEWHIRGLELFPPRAVPGGVFVAKAVLSLPAGSDPWMRWRQDGRIAAEGFLSEGLGRVVLQAGTDSDMESVSLELLSGPPDGSLLPLRNFHTDIYIGGEPEPDPDDLGPPDSYDLLLHFNGVLRDVSGDRKHTGLSITGSPWPVQTPSGMGFRFNGSGGLVMDHLDPVFTGTNGWQPFSITVTVLPLNTPPGNLLRLEDRHGFSMVMDVSGTDGVSLTMKHGDSEVISALPMKFTGKEPRAVTVSFLPGDGSLNILWQVDGDTRAMERLDQVIPAPEGELRFSLGGAEEFDGIVTELALHTRDSTGRAAVEGDRFDFYSRLHRRVITAEGFEDNLLVSGIQAGGQAAVADGALILPPSASVQFSAAGGIVLGFDDIPSGDGATLSQLSGETGEAFRQWPVSRDDLNRDSGGAFRLEKTAWMSDNVTEANFELTASSQNGSNLRLEHILVTRD